MKPVQLIFAVLAVAALGSCTKLNDQNPDFFIAAQRDGQSWSAQPIASYISIDTLQLQGLKTTLPEDLQVNIRFNGVNTYTIKKGQALYVRQLSPSGPTVEYNLDTTQTNTVTIDSYTIASGAATGSFQLNFIQPGISGSSNKVVFTGGKFWMPIPLPPKQ